MNQIEERVTGAIRISTDPQLLDLELIHHELSHSYWAEGIARALVEKSLRGSLCFGAYEESSGRQVGFARVVSDFATFAYVGDVFVIPSHRGQGISKFLMRRVLEHPELRGLRRICLGTRDAHSLYQRFGFRSPDKPENWLEIKVPHPYKGVPGPA